MTAETSSKNQTTEQPAATAPVFVDPWEKFKSEFIDEEPILTAPRAPETQRLSSSDTTKRITRDGREISNFGKHIR